MRSHPGEGKAGADEATGSGADGAGGDSAPEEGSVFRRDPFTPIGTSPAMQRVLELARKVAPSDAPVLITGEGGTGKEMVAQWIHRGSRRHQHTLLPVNCALLAPEIVEEEIFGAEHDPGLLERARGGTLLLDDVDHLPPLVQVRLLRVIEQRIAREPVGKASAEGANLRFMSTLAVPADEAVAQGRLRADLFYRLAIFPIHIPPLRERRDDIPLLARHFLAHFWRLDRKRRAKSPTLSTRAVQALQERPWPGNVRELQNLMERAAIVLGPGQQVGPDDLPEADPPAPPPQDIVARPEHWGSAGLEASNRPPAGSFLFEALLDETFSEAKSRMTENFERAYLTRLIRHVGGNMQAAAKLGGVNKTTLYRLLQKHDLTKEDVLKA